jgi:hypothetical protein
MFYIADCLALLIGRHQTNHLYKFNGLEAIEELEKEPSNYSGG